MTMPIEESDFKGQLKYEDIQFFFRRHWVRFIKAAFFTFPIVLLIIFILVLFGRLTLMIDFMFVRVFYILFTMVISAIFLNVAFLQLINYYFHMVVVTSTRILIVNKTVFLQNNSDAIDLTKIQDIGVEAHGLLRNYLGYGKLIIVLSTSAPPIVIESVPNPHYYLEWMNRVKREHIMTRQEKKTVPPKGSESLAQKRAEYLKDIDTLTE